MRRAVIIVTALALTLIGSAALASIPDANGVIHACRNNSNGSVRIIDTASQSCSGNETEVTWNQTGPQGPAGATGATGATGPAGPATTFNYTPWSMTVAANSVDSTTVTCPGSGSGRYGVSMGISKDPGSTLEVRNSEPQYVPLHTAPGWRVVVDNPASQSQFIGGTLVCAAPA